MIMNRVISGILSLFLMAGGLIAFVPFDSRLPVSCIPGIIGYAALLIEIMYPRNTNSFFRIWALVKRYAYLVSRGWTEKEKVVRRRKA